jgi:endonuclease YncB( thermonuclease family)
LAAVSPVRAFVTAMALLCVAMSAVAAEPRPTILRGKVVGVTDGDTITVLVDRKVIKVRLLEIDAPEHDQPWGERSKQMLSSLVFAHQVELRAQGTDRYGRTLARVYAGGVDVCSAMVRSGSAWAFRRYLTDQSILRMEADARRARRGLWSLPKSDVVAPWEWRRTSDSTPHGPAGIHLVAPFTAGSTCGRKHLCGQMTSCAEAKHYLRSCGVSSLDRDRDGVPCDSICTAAAR